MEPVLRTSPESTKEEIRQMVWKYIEDKNLANFPRPVYNRIPNFKGASFACAKVSELQSFTKAAEIKVDPDKPLERARLLILQAQKTLLVPTPRLRTGLFNKITPPPNATKHQLRVCSTSQGVKDFSVPVGLDAQMKVDLVVVGSVAVSEKGFRIGKGEGYADMEYGMMASMGAVTDSTVVVTVVHDCQVVEIPKRVIESHDLTVNYILTPTRIIKTGCQLPKPQGIIWSKLDTEKLEKIPILKQLRSVEEQAGKDVALGEALTKATQRPRPNSYKDAKGDLKHDRGAALEQTSRRSKAAVRKENRQDGARLITDTASSLFVGSIPAELRVSELKSLLRQKEASPLRLTWHGAQHRAFLDYTDPPAADRALLALQDLSVNGHKLLVELAKSQRKTRPHQAAPGLQ